MTTLDEYSSLATWRMCLFGRAKVGKTALATALAQVFKLHYIDLEDGVKTALNPAILPVEFRKNINWFPIQTSQKNPLSIETLLKVFKGTECMICLKHGKVGCQPCTKENAKLNRLCLNEFTPDDMLVIDSSTQLSTDASFATNPVIRNAEIAEDFVLGKDTGGKDFKYPMAVSFVLDRIFGTMQTMRINCIVISHEVMTERTKDTGHVVGAGQNQPSDNVEMIFPAAGSRNFSRNFGRYFDALIHLDVVNKRHTANSSSTYSTQHQTGSRLQYNIEDMKGADGKPLAPNLAIVELFKKLRNGK